MASANEHRLERIDFTDRRRHWSLFGTSNLDEELRSGLYTPPAVPLAGASRAAGEKEGFTSLIGPPMPERYLNPGVERRLRKEL
jgi:hypothetical protein